MDKDKNKSGIYRARKDVSGLQEEFVNINHVTYRRFAQTMNQIICLRFIKPKV